MASPAELEVIEAAVEHRVLAPELLAPAADGSDLRSLVGLKLAFGMLLHHFSIGAWSVTIASYIKANSGTAGAGIFAAGFVGTIYGAGPLGGMISPFLTGVLADRFFSSEKLMAVCHTLAAGALWCAATAQSQAGLFFWIFVFYTLYLPAFTLLSAMTFHQFKRPQKHFPVVRACGTFGWVLAGVFVGWVWPRFFGEAIEATSIPLKIGVISELLLAAYSLWLPPTPPSRPAPLVGQPELGRSAVGDLLRRRSFMAVLFVATITHILPQFYYAYCNVFLNWSRIDYPAAKMTGGQVIEIVCMLLMPAFLPRIGVRRAILLGLSIWTVRYFLLAVAADAGGSWAPTCRVFAIWPHGIAFALVSISLQLEVDRHAGSRLRATAQGLVIIAMQGFGYLFGAHLAGAIGRRTLAPELDAATTEQWRQFWLFPAWGMVAVGVATALILPRDETLPASSGGGRPAESVEIS